LTSGDSMASIKENLQKIRQNIEQACMRAGRRPDEVRIVAVTKYVNEARAREAVEAGLTHIGENRLEGLTEKRRALADLDVTWHFIGTLQSRKVKDVLPQVDYIHSLDRLSLAKEIQKRAERAVKCFVQVNVSGEATKHGIREDDVLPFIDRLREFPNITVVGLMTMAPANAEEDELRRIFRRLKNWQRAVEEKHWEHAPCHELSMGMSGDYIVAVEEGATFVRIGSALVGNDG
jgi:pyridoxal phosphate enzyme (YggS family)